MKFYSIYKREIRSCFQSPGFFVAGGIFLLLSGFFFFNSMTFFSLMSSDPDLRRQFGITSLNLTQDVIKDIFSAMNFLLLFIVPMMTMRSYAEERKSGTYELLLSYPFQTWEVLAGKYLACVSALSALFLLTIVYPVLTARFGSIEVPVVLSCYLGLVLSSLAYVAFGIFTSALTENQIIAAVLSFAGLLFFYIVDLLSFGRFGKFETFVKEISFVRHNADFTQGIISAVDVYYFLGFVAFFLMVTVVVLELQRRGLKD